MTQIQQEQSGGEGTPLVELSAPRRGAVKMHDVWDVLQKGGNTREANVVAEAEAVLQKLFKDLHTMDFWDRHTILSRIQAIL